MDIIVAKLSKASHLAKKGGGVEGGAAAKTGTRPREEAPEDKFADSFKAVRGTVDPDLKLGF